MDDVADAHVLCLDKLTNESADIYNLGIGRRFSVLEVLKAAKQVTGKEITVQYGERRVGDCERLVANTDKIRRELGWKVRYNTIEEMIVSAWYWHCKSNERRE